MGQLSPGQLAGIGMYPYEEFMDPDRPMLYLCMPVTISMSLIIHLRIPKLRINMKALEGKPAKRRLEHMGAHSIG